MKFTSLAIAFAVIGTEAIKIEVDPITVGGAIAYNAASGYGCYRAIKRFDEKYGNLSPEG